jgi:hypothetical protein
MLVNVSTFLGQLFAFGAITALSVGIVGLLNAHLDHQDKIRKA